MALVIVASDVDAYERHYHNRASNTAPEDNLDAPETIIAPAVVTCVAMATYSAHNWDRTLPTSQKNRISVAFFQLTPNPRHC